MSHVTLEQAKRFKELGYPQGGLNETGMAVQCDCGLQMMHADLDTDWIVGMDYSHSVHDWDADHEWWRAPSTEELMEWLKDKINLCIDHASRWHVADFNRLTQKDFTSDRLIDALFQATCWVLEGKK